MEHVGESLLEKHKQISDAATKLKRQRRAKKKAEKDAARYQRNRTAIISKATEYYLANRPDILTKRKDKYYEEIMMINSGDMGAHTFKTGSKNSTDDVIKMKYEDIIDLMKSLPLPTTNVVLLTIANFLRDHFKSCGIDGPLRREILLYSVLRRNEAWFESLSKGLRHREYESLLSRINFHIEHSSGVDGWDYDKHFGQLIREHSDSMGLLTDQLTSVLSNFLQNAINLMQRRWRSKLEPSMCDILVYMFLTINENTILMWGFSEMNFQVVMGPVRERLLSMGILKWKYDRRLLPVLKRYHHYGGETSLNPPTIELYDFNGDSYFKIVPNSAVYWKTRKSKYRNFGKRLKILNGSMITTDRYTRKEEIYNDTASLILE